MDKKAPIYTEKNECQDCYKCVRSCPVKAIKIEFGVASVIDSKCISCGTCVNVCPASAKRTRNDVGKVKELLAAGQKIIVSLAPSCKVEFSEWKRENFIFALKKIGFYGVSETALGAQEVSSHVAERMKNNGSECYISSACPVVVEYITKYRPDLLPFLTNLTSPLLAHCRLLRSMYGPSYSVVFFGPCIAKKREADSLEDGLVAALTFEDLRIWFREEGLHPLTVVRDENEIYDFIPYRAKEGILYPVEGGMISCVKSNCTTSDTQCMSFSGIESIMQVLDDIESNPRASNLFLELLACPGGCVNGPMIKTKHSILTKRAIILHSFSDKNEVFPRPVALDCTVTYNAIPTVKRKHLDENIDTVLRQTGKVNKNDEFNCGGCGYNSCREFAVAVLEGYAEPVMCVTYMRQLAQKKANKLIQSIPSAVVIVDSALKIIECNQKFARLAGKDVETIFEVHQGLQGAVFEKILPLSPLFRHVLETNEDIIEKDVSVGKKILSCSLFVIEKGNSIGCILNDITEPSLKKDEIIKRTRQVIQKNLKTVQKIAYLLGENAADTELSLNAIIESFENDLQYGDEHE